MKTTQYSDVAIVEGCLREDRRFQQLLYERFYGSMMTVCMRYTGDREEARDVLHEGFIKVFGNLTKYEQGTNLGAWIRRVVVNTAIDCYRRSSKIPPSVEVNTAIHEADSRDVLAEMSAAEILKLVQSLTPAYRAVFNMYVMDGYSHKEIGEMLGISEGTSKSNLSKARMKLQKMVLDLQR